MIVNYRDSGGSYASSSGKGMAWLDGTGLTDSIDGLFVDKSAESM